MCIVLSAAIILLHHPARREISRDLAKSHFNTSVLSTRVWYNLFQAASSHYFCEIRVLEISYKCNKYHKKNVKSENTF